MKHPFPFIGAGYGQYFEWFEMHLIFENTPDAKEAKAILASAPEPIRPENVDFTSRYLIVSSDQFVNAHIQAVYGKEDDDLDELSEYEASKGASDAFEEDLYRWLLETHQICPILAAYRPEDDEAGGTELSDWHDESGEMIRPIIESWIKNEAGHEKGIEYIMLNALYYYFMGDPIALPILENCITPALFVHLLQDAEHANLLQTEEVEKGLLKLMPNLGFDHKPFVAEVILHAVRTDSDELKRQLIGVIQKLSIANMEWLNRHWYNNYMVTDGFTKEIIGAYWMLMDALEASEKELVDLSVYNNIMVACMRESNGKVSEERMRKALVIGEKYAPNNPLMYWNIFTLQCELGDLENALSNIDEYFKSDDPNKEYLTGEVKKNKEYAAFRATEAGGEFVKGL